MNRRGLAALLAILFVLELPCRAMAQSSAFLQDYDKLPTSSDYIVKRFPNQKLMPIRIIGGVGRPGFYQVPEDTTLLSLLSYSGGTQSRSDVDNINILRTAETKSLNVNLNQILSDPNIGDVKLAANDVVYIKEKKDFFSNTFLTTVVVLASVTGTVLTVLTIRDNIRASTGAGKMDSPLSISF